MFYWDDEKHRKEFFMEFAQKRGIDPLRAEHWYSVTRADVCASMKVNIIYLYHYHHYLFILLLLSFKWIQNFMKRKIIIIFKKGARSVLGHYGDSLVQALVTLFPNINLQPSKFIAVPSILVYIYIILLLKLILLLF